MGTTFVCHVGGLVVPDVVAVDALVRLQLAARRSGCRIALHQPPQGLCELLDLMGLGDVFRVTDSACEAPGEPEQREEPLGVQEEADPHDLDVADLEDL
jgi:STAS domain